MKRSIAIFCILALLLTFSACKQKVDPYYPTLEDVTIESLLEHTIPKNMLSYQGGFQIDFRNDDAMNAGADAGTTSMRFLYDGEKVLINQMVDYDDGEFTHLFFTSDLNDLTVYSQSDMGYSTMSLAETMLKETLEGSLLGLDSLQCEITSRSHTDTGFQVTYDAKYDENVVHSALLNIDPVSGYVTDGILTFYDGSTVSGENKISITYSRNIYIDQSPKDNAPAEETAPSEDSASTGETAAAKSGIFNFATTDLDGNFVSYNDFADAKLIMVNFWEPWCNPCVSEMPDLENLYEDYKDEGVIILGVFSTEDADEDARAVVEQTGVTYPILHCDSNLALYQTDSVPTTIFVDHDGNVIDDERYIGSKSYYDWLDIIRSYLD